MCHRLVKSKYNRFIILSFYLTVNIHFLSLIGRMLIREPERRASLAEIASDPWLMEGAKETQSTEYLPLVSRHQVSEEDHNIIIQKMVNGNIASKEEILE